ncbi:MAG: CDP-alcohol phosphatidyltransferase family protein [Gammaproteobacteria bacterium]|jgi:cardiolipin synthase
MKARDIPNIITLFRFLLVPPVVVLLLKQQFASALVVFGIAGFSDALDGFLAKHYGWTSRLGGLLDPLADKLLLLGCFITLGWLGLIPWWLIVLVVVRDIVILTGAVVYNFLIEQLEAAPSPVSKLNTFTQILLVLAIMFAEGIQALPDLWLDVLLYSVLVTTVWSGIGYVWSWSRRAWQRRES